MGARRGKRGAGKKRKSTGRTPFYVGQPVDEVIAVCKKTFRERKKVELFLRADEGTDPSNTFTLEHGTYLITPVEEGTEVPTILITKGAPCWTLTDCRLTFEHYDKMFRVSKIEVF